MPYASSQTLRPRLVTCPGQQTGTLKQASLELQKISGLEVMIANPLAASFANLFSMLNTLNVDLLQKEQNRIRKGQQINLFGM